MEEEYVDAVMAVAWERWFEPEILRRERAGLIDDEWKIGAAQVLFWPNGTPEVLFNNEVAGSFKMKLSKPSVKMTPGEIVEINERFETISEFRLEAEAPVGFATFIRHRGKWHYFGNQCHNLGVVDLDLAGAEEFLHVARFAASERKFRAFVDNLFSACELVTKTLLLQFPEVHDPKTTHGWIAKQFHFLAKYCGIDSSYVATVKRLGTLRQPARYVRGHFALADDEAERLLAAVERMLVEVRAKTATTASLVIKNPG